MKKRNVILITVDCLRADHCSCYGYYKKTTPFIDFLAEKGLKFENAFANGPDSPHAFKTIFTSSYPLDISNTAFLPKNKIFLPKILKENGIQTAAIHSNAYLSGYYGYNIGWDYFEDFLIRERIRKNSIITKSKKKLYPIFKKMKLLKFYRKFKNQFPQKIFQHEDDKLIQYSAIKWLSNSSKQPFFLWIHYLDAHWPYYPRKQFKRFSYDISKKDELKLNKKCFSKKNYKEKLIELYDDCILGVDNYISELFSVLKQLNYLKNTAVIITADHGEQFGEHGSFASHPVKLYNEQLKIPLILYNTGKNGIVLKFADQLNIAPTILKLFNLPNIYRHESLLEIKNKNFVIAEAARNKKGILIDEKKLNDDIFITRAYITKKWKYILNEDKNDELYNLEKDPKEQKNIIKKYPKIAKKMKEKLKQHIIEQKKNQLKMKIQKIKYNSK